MAAKENRPIVSHAALKPLPSPPTSTPSCTPPLVPLKRKSVAIAPAPLGSAHSVPNHRSTPSGKQSRQLPSAPLESRQADRLRKRARLSLATPRTSPVPRNLALCASAGPPRPRPTSPLAARSSAKSLDKFYFHARPPPTRVESPTLSASAPSKKDPRPATPSDDDAIDSDSSDDESIARELLPRNSPICRAGPPRPHGGLMPAASLPRSASFPSFDSPSPRRTIRQVGLRPILKKTQAPIALADTLEHGTRSNGRPRPAFDSLLFANRTRLASQALLAVTGNTPGAMLSPSSRPSVANSASASGSTIRRPAHNACARANGKPQDDDQSGDEDAFTAKHPVSSSSASNRENALLASIRSSLVTLQASLRPPPQEMRLDPLSPLAPLTSPQRKQVGQLGNLLGSPREPRDLLPRAVVQNARVESGTVEIKAKGKRRVRTLVCSNATSLTRSTPILVTPLSSPVSSPSTSASAAISTPPPSHAAHPRTPDQPARSDHLHALPRAVITLREVEEAYVSLHEQLTALRHHWQDEAQLTEDDQKFRLATIFEPELAQSLMTCLVRELENLCRLKTQPDPQPPPPPPSGPAQARHQLSQPELGLRTSSSPAIISTVVTKVGTSTNEIRRRVAEIETGQASLWCLGILWSWQSLLAYLSPTHVQRLLTLLVQLPGVALLHRKKHLPVIGTLNHIFKAQALSNQILAPHLATILTAVSHTIYTSAGKSGEKGKRVIWLALGAFRNLVTQSPQGVARLAGSFIEPLLSSLCSVQAASLRHEGLSGLGALVNGFNVDWDGDLGGGGKVTGVASEDQSARKREVRDNLSRYTFAHLTSHPELKRWALLNTQLHTSLVEGDVGWVISCMATVIALLGKRLRRTDPPVTKCFKQHFQILLTKDGLVRQLAQQLWDYYILTMLIWSIGDLHDDYQEAKEIINNNQKEAENNMMRIEQKRRTIWCLEKGQLAFFLQIFHHSYFWSPGSSTSSSSSGPVQSASSKKVLPVMALNGALVKDLDGLLLGPSVSTTTTMTTTTTATATATATGERAFFNSRPVTSAKREVAKDSTLHHTLSSFLYGTIGCVQEHISLPLPLVPPIVGPEDWLEQVEASDRFLHLDIVWDEIVERGLPGLLTGPVLEHQLYASQILVSLCGGQEDNGNISSNNCGSKGKQEERNLKAQTWTTERFIHQVFHQPPIIESMTANANHNQSSSGSKIDLKAFAIAGSLSLIKPCEIPSLDILWICHRSPKVLKLVFKALRCCDYSSSSSQKVIEVWRAYIRVLKRVWTTWSLLEKKFWVALEEVVRILESLIVGGIDDDNDWKLFEDCYGIIKVEIGDELLSCSNVNQPASSVAESSCEDFNQTIKARRISVFSRLLIFFLERSLIEKVHVQHQFRYGELLSKVLDDLIRTRKLSGSPDKLKELGVELSNFITTSLSSDLIWLKHVIGKAISRTTTDIIKQVELGVDCNDAEEGPIEDWCLNLIELNLDCFMVDVGLSLARLIGRCSYLSFKKILLSGCGRSIEHFVVGCCESDVGQQLYRACLSRFSSASQFDDQDLEKVVTAIIRSPFEMSKIGTQSYTAAHDALLEFPRRGNLLSKVVDDILGPLPVEYSADRSVLSPLWKRPAEAESLEARLGLGCSHSVRPDDEDDDQRVSIQKFFPEEELIETIDEMLHIQPNGLMEQERSVDRFDEHKLRKGDGQPGQYKVIPAESVDSPQLGSELVGEEPVQGSDEGIQRTEEEQTGHSDSIEQTADYIHLETKGVVENRTDEEARDVSKAEEQASQSKEMISLRVPAANKELIENSANEAENASDQSHSRKSDFQTSRRRSKRLSAVVVAVEIEDGASQGDPRRKRRSGSGGSSQPDTVNEVNPEPSNRLPDSLAGSFTRGKSSMRISKQLNKNRSETRSSPRLSNENKQDEINEGRALKRRRTRLSSASATNDDDKSVNLERRQDRRWSTRKRCTSLHIDQMVETFSDGELANVHENSESFVDESGSASDVKDHGPVPQLGQGAASQDCTPSAAEPDGVERTEGEDRPAKVSMSCLAALEHTESGASNNHVSVVQPVGEGAIRQAVSNVEGFAAELVVEGPHVESAELDEQPFQQDFASGEIEPVMDNAERLSSVPGDQLLACQPGNALVPTTLAQAPLADRNQVLMSSRSNSPETLPSKSGDEDDIGEHIDLVDARHDRPSQEEFVCSLIPLSSSFSPLTTRSSLLAPPAVSKEVSEQSATSTRIVTGDVQGTRLDSMRPTEGTVKSNPQMSDTDPPRLASPASFEGMNASLKGPTGHLAYPVMPSRLKTASPASSIGQDMTLAESKLDRSMSEVIGEKSQPLGDLPQHVGTDIALEGRQPPNSSTNGSNSAQSAHGGLQPSLALPETVMSDSQRARLSLMGPAKGICVATGDSNARNRAAPALFDEMHGGEDLVASGRGRVDHQGEAVLPSSPKTSAVELMKDQETVLSEKTDTDLGSHEKTQVADDPLQDVSKTATSSKNCPISASDLSMSLPRSTSLLADADALATPGSSEVFISDSQKARLSLMSPARGMAFRNAQKFKSGIDRRKALVSLESLMQLSKRGSEESLGAGKVAVIGEPTTPKTLGTVNELRSPIVLAGVSDQLAVGGSGIKETVQMSDCRMSLLAGRNPTANSITSPEKSASLSCPQELAQAKAMITPQKCAPVEETIAHERNSEIDGMASIKAGVCGSEVTRGGSAEESAELPKAAEGTQITDSAHAVVIESHNVASHQVEDSTPTVDDPGAETSRTTARDQPGVVETTNEETGCRSEAQTENSGIPAFVELQPIVVNHSPSVAPPAQLNDFDQDKMENEMTTGDSESLSSIALIDATPSNFQAGRRMSTRRISPTKSDSPYRPVDLQTGSKESLDESANEFDSHPPEPDKVVDNHHDKSNQSEVGTHQDNQVSINESVVGANLRRSSRKRAHPSVNDDMVPTYSPAKRTRRCTARLSTITIEDRPVSIRSNTITTNVEVSIPKIDPHLLFLPIVESFEKTDDNNFFSKVDPRLLLSPVMKSSNSCITFSFSPSKTSNSSEILRRSSRINQSHREESLTSREGMEEGISGREAEVDDFADQTQNFRDHIESLSTERLVKLSRVASSVIEDRVTTRSRSGLQKTRRLVN